MEIKVKNKRDNTFDIARALCTIWIVGFWHMAVYADYSPSLKYFKSDIGSFITIAALSAFTFMSGYFIGMKKITNLVDIKIFYIQRLKRFWVLFFISSLLLYSIVFFTGNMWYKDIMHFMASLVGLSCFFPPVPSTLWYISMLMFFYLISPFILLFQKENQRIVCSIICFFLIWNLIDFLEGDTRFILYLSMYLLGLLLPKSIMGGVKRNWKKVLILNTVIFITTIIICNLKVITTQLLSSSENAILPISIDTYLINLVISIAGLFVIISLSQALCLSNMVVLVTNKISYASMAMYMFHRQFFCVVMFFASLGGITRLPMILAELIFLPLLIIVSFYIQKVYDYSMSFQKSK